MASADRSGDLPPRSGRGLAPLQAARPDNRRLLGVLRALAAWRETAAQQRDLPRNRMLRDESVLEIAAHAPQTVDELARTRGLGKGFAEGKLGGEILAAVDARLAAAGERLSERRRRGASRRRASGRWSICCACCLKLRCEENEVAQKLVADAEDLEAIAADDAAPVRALTGWRHEMFGSDALALKHGRLALTAAGKRIKLVRSRRRREPRPRHVAPYYARLTSVRPAEAAAERVEPALHRFAEQQRCSLDRQVEDELSLGEAQRGPRQQAGHAAAQRIGEPQRQADARAASRRLLVEQGAAAPTISKPSRAAIARMQRQREEDALVMIERRRPACRARAQRLLGAVIGMLGPGDIAEQRRRATQAPALARLRSAKSGVVHSTSAVAIVAEARLGARPSSAQAAISGSARCCSHAHEAVEMALAQAERREDELGRAGAAQDALQDARRERHHLEALARDRGDPLQRFARLARR